MEAMRVAVMRDRKLVVAEVPMPQPGSGKVLVRALACGICGSDLPRSATSRMARSRPRRSSPGTSASAGWPRLSTSSAPPTARQDPGASRALSTAARLGVGVDRTVISLAE
jgi:hypothetical protein